VLYPNRLIYLFSFSTFPRPHILPFDHIYPPGKTLQRPPRTAILYASLDSKNFRSLHSHLYRLAASESPRIEYVLRYVTPKERDFEKKATLSGYGVALDLKKTDYLALDDRHLGKRLLVVEAPMQTLIAPRHPI
jgi:UDP-glucose:glycoprotein glucosyltransferase